MRNKDYLPYLVQADITKYLRLSGLHNTNLFLTSWRLEVQNQDASRVEFWWGPTLLQVADGQFLVPSLTEGELASALRLLIRALIPFLKSASSGSKHLPQSPPPNTITLRSGFKHRNLGAGRGTNIQSIATTPGNLCLQTISVFHFISVNIEVVRQATQLLKLLVWLNTFMPEIVIVYLCVNPSFRHCCLSDKHWGVLL